MSHPSKYHKNGKYDDDICDDRGGGVKRGVDLSRARRDRSRSRSPRKNEEKNCGGKGIQIRLNRPHSAGGGGAGTAKAPIKMALSKPRPTATVSHAFNQDSSDEEPEEMPPEARMRMRNIGRDTPTSSGPNSFGKTKYGFSDLNKVHERNVRKAQETAASADTTLKR